MKLEHAVPISELPFIAPLIKAYLTGEPSIRHLYEHEFSIEAFEQVIAKRANSPINRTALVEVLTNQYAPLSRNTLVDANIDLLRQENTFTITAAHQPCLFLGPLFNLLKIAGTIVTATQLKEKYPAYNFVPLFWMGSEDHDKEELCNTLVGEQKIEWKTEDNGVIGKFSLNGLQEAVQELKATLHIASHELFDALEKGLTQCADFGQLTQHISHELFKEFGLVVIDQNDVLLKKQFVSIIEDEIINQRAEQLLQPTIKWLEENYTAQAKPRPINFFYIQPHARERIVTDEKGFKTNDGSVQFTREELVNAIKTQPEKFSPNVFFRPLLQELVLPNLAFVGGPGEISYWLELKTLFDYYKIPFPMLVFRSMGALMRKNAFEKLAKLNLQPIALFKEKDTLIKEWVKEHSEHDLSVSDEKAQITAIYESLVQKSVEIDKTLENSIRGELQKTLNGVDAIAAKMIKAEKRNQETALNQLENLYKTFLPNGLLMERSENMMAAAIRLSKEELVELVHGQSPFAKEFRFWTTE